jgi:hypothetical protein
MNRRTLAIVAVVVVCVLALLMTLVKRGVAAEWAGALRIGLQPVPAWHPPVRFGFRDSSCSTRGGRHRRPSACTLAHVTAPDSGRSASGAYEYRDGSNRDARRAHAFRQEHVTKQESSMRVLPHAVRGLRRTDPLGQPDNHRVSGNGSLPGGQADPAATPVFPILPCTPIQPGAGAVLWWQFL